MSQLDSIPDTMSQLDSIPDTMSQLDSILKRIQHEYPHSIYKVSDRFEDTDADVVEKLSDIKHRLPYAEGMKLFSDHIGQRKLIMNEIQFLKKTSSKYCIYVGSAPGHKTYLLSQLFPDIKFILVDPNKFELLVNKKTHRRSRHKDIIHMSSGYHTRSNIWDRTKQSCTDFIKDSTHKIFIFEEFMTDEMAHMFKSLDASFISDIRTNVYDYNYPTDYDIYWNYSMMFNWMRIMRPPLSMIKFRIPYFKDGKEFVPNKAFDQSIIHGIDFISDYNNKKLRLPKSELYIQPWAPQSSTELRAVIEDVDDIIEYDITDIEERMLYYNTIERSWVCHYNPNADKYLRFCRCNDCALENKIWSSLGLSSDEILDNVAYLGNITFRPLSETHRHPIYHPHSINDMNAIIDRWEPRKKRKFPIRKGNRCL